MERPLITNLFSLSRPLMLRVDPPLRVRVQAFLLLMTSLGLVACDDEQGHGLIVDEGVVNSGESASETAGESGGETAGEGAGEAAGESSGETAGEDAGETVGNMLSLEEILTATVSVQFDEMSGLHLTCSTLADCFAAQGYYHAAHRFTQMDINRLFPQGRVGERIGNLALNSDRRSRLIFSTRDGGSIEERMWESCSDESKGMLEAYSKGVNAWLAKWRSGSPDAKLSEEYNFPIFDKSTIKDWTPLDSLSVALVLIQDLTERSGRQLRNAELLRLVGPALYHDLFGDTPAFPTSVLSGEDGVDAIAPPISLDQDKGDTPSLFGLEALHRRLSVSQDFHAEEWLAHSAWRGRPESEPSPIGSNNWVIDPSRSSTENAWLSNDPHLGLSNPSTWYIAHLKLRDRGEDSSASFNVSGVSLPGIPSIIIGHNEHIAWGMTTTYFDFTDVYVEQLSADGQSVIFEGQEVPLVRRNDRYDLAGMAAENGESLYVPHHGPIIAMNPDEGVAFTMRWTGQDTDHDVNFLLDLARSSTVSEARDALRSVTSIGQNFVVADDQGSIGWFPYNRLPSRPWASQELNPSFPLPGDGSAEWGEPIPYEELPQLFNPDSGFIVTANHDMTGALNDGDPTNDLAQEGPARAMQESPANGYRYSQSTRLVARDEPHQRDSLSATIHDRELLLARRLLPSIIQAVDLSSLTESGQRALATLSPWGSGPRGYDCPSGMTLSLLSQAVPNSDDQERADSAGCYVFHVLYSELRKHIFGDELFEATGVRNQVPYLEAVARLIARPESLAGGVSYWDDVSTDVEEDPGFTIAAALNSTGSYFNREYGANTDEWLWGKVHTVTLNAAIINNAGVKDFNNGPYPNHGGLYTVDVANPRDLHERDYDHSSGASMRFVCELSSPPACQIEIPGGQRHHRDSPHYEDLLRRWLDREPWMIPFSDEEIAAQSIETLQLP